ncbi:MAG: diaminobutyrate acetyltransferase [Gammaproteobacteria bacterium]|nr:diaminobutyrate acetyltransferase [Gammaproteobacteria bacterium]
MGSSIALRRPEREDGAAVFQLVNQCPPLDANSMYCNLLQCSHFAETSVAAASDDELVGFISAYIVPNRDDALFIWQVAVSEKARGEGLATRMLEHILDREVCRQITFIETTITESNPASWALFESMARRLDTGLERSLMFDRDKHFNGEHDSEHIARIGPFFK